MHSSFFTLLGSRKVIFGIVGAILTIGLLSVLIGQRSAERGIKISVLFSEDVSYGTPFEARIAVANFSRSALESATLSLSLPEGISFLDQPDGQLISFRDLGAIEQSTRREERFDLIATSGAPRDIRVLLSYAQPGVASRFEESRSIIIPFRGDGVLLSLITPERVAEGEDFEFAVMYENTTNVLYPDVTLHFDAPEGLEISSVFARDPASQDIVIGNVNRKSKRTMTFRAVARGAFEQYVLRAKLFARFEGVADRPIAEAQATIILSSSSVSIHLVVNDVNDFIASRDEALRYVVRYENGSNTVIRDARIRVVMSGDMFEFGTLETFGVWNARDHSITWDSFSTPELAIIEPGESGSVLFSVRTRPEYPIRRLSDRNFILRVDAELSSQTSLGGSREPVMRSARLETKVRGDIVLDAFGLFRDAPSGILNQGMMPLRANARTDFTIHWTLQNYGTDMEQVRVVAHLGDRAEFTNTYKNTLMGTTLIYHPTDRTVTWNIPNISATRGVLDAKPEVIFQVSVTPRESDIGRPLQIIGRSDLSSKDAFTGLSIQRTVGPITTETLTDPTVGQNDGVVVP